MTSPSKSSVTEAKARMPQVKSAVFLQVVGTDQEPLAKSTVPLVLFPILAIYNVLVSKLGHPKFLVLCVCELFSVVFLILVFALFAETEDPSPWIGWVLYYASEVRGVMIMPMVWSVVVDTSTLKSSKSAIPLIFFACQIGGILGSLCAMSASSLGDRVGLLILQVVALQVIIGSVWLGSYYSSMEEPEHDESTPLPQPPESGAGTFPQGVATADESSNSVVGKSAWEIVEGIWLIVSRPYVLMLFWVSYAHLMPRTILDYQTSVLVTANIPKGQQVSYFGTISLYTNIGTAVLTLFGTRSLVESFGEKWCLLVLPCVLWLCVGAMCLCYGLATSVRTLVLASILTYGLNSPCKEMLYIPTTPSIKYKAKSWSEMYGNQLQKFAGAQVNLWLNRDLSSCKPHCFQKVPTICIVTAWCFLWLGTAYRAGKEREELEESGKIVS